MDSFAAATFPVAHFRVKRWTVIVIEMNGYEWDMNDISALMGVRGPKHDSFDERMTRNNSTLILRIYLRIQNNSLEQMISQLPRPAHSHAPYSEWDTFCADIVCLIVIYLLKIYTATTTKAS